MKKLILLSILIFAFGCSSATYKITIPEAIKSGAAKAKDGVPYSVFIYIFTDQGRKGLDSFLRADGGQANVAQGAIQAENAPTISEAPAK